MSEPQTEATSGAPLAQGRPGRPKTLRASATDQDIRDAEIAALRADIARLKAEVAAAPVATTAPEAPKVSEPPRADTELYGRWTAPRELHGIRIKDAMNLSGRHDYLPGHTYSKLTVGEVRTIISAWSAACMQLAMKDKDEGRRHFLGEIHEDA